MGNQPRPRQLFLFIGPWEGALGQAGMESYGWARMVPSITQPGLCPALQAGPAVVCPGPG